MRKVLTSTSLIILLSSIVLVGCKKSSTTGGGDQESSKKRQRLSMGTAPVGGAFNVVGNSIAEVLNANPGSIEWKINANGTKGSQENIRRLQSGDLQIGLSNAAISYFAARGEGSWDKEYDIRAIATLAPNVALFITRSDSGIKAIADLKGKQVITGPSGAGFQMFIEPILQEHGVGWEDINSSNATQSGAVDLLGDGSADAAFLGGAVPTGSIIQATSTFDVTFVPFDTETRETLIEKYPFFHPATIPGGTYKGMDEDYQGLNVGSMHLITSASQDDELIYEITKAIWENREAIAEKHPAGKAINPKNVARNTGIEYHPGAKKFYEEVGIWPGSEEAESPAESSEESSEAAAE